MSYLDENQTDELTRMIEWNPEEHKGKLDEVDNLSRAILSTCWELNIGKFEDEYNERELKTRLFNNDYMTYDQYIYLNEIKKQYNRLKEEYPHINRLLITLRN